MSICLQSCKKNHTKGLVWSENKHLLIVSLSIWSLIEPWANAGVNNKEEMPSISHICLFVFLYSVFTWIANCHENHLHHHEWLHLQFSIFSPSNCLITHFISARECVWLYSVYECAYTFIHRDSLCFYTKRKIFLAKKGNFQCHYALLGITSRIQPAGADSCKQELPVLCTEATGSSHSEIVCVCCCLKATLQKT